MRNLFPAAGVCIAVASLALGACAPSDSNESSATDATTGSVVSSSTAPSAPPVPEPAAEEACPYLDTAWVERTNGQRVSEVRISDDDETPACFFYTLDGEQQLMSRVYSGDRAVAVAIVDAAAPVDESNQATEPAGWRGGYLSDEDGATYAVARDDTAVVVTTNQGQSVKARSVVERVIEELGL